MAIYNEPEPKAAVGDLFRQQLERLKEHAEDEKKAIKNEAPPKWYRPKDFDSDLFDIKAFHEPFKRDQQEEDFDKAVKDPESPGTTGDLYMVLLQGDFMHAFERAFRARHHSEVRTRIHPCGRKHGHSHENGVIMGGMLGYLINVDKISKGEQT